MEKEKLVDGHTEIAKGIWKNNQSHKQCVCLYVCTHNPAYIHLLVNHLKESCKHL